MNENTHGEQNVSETEDDTSEEEYVTEMQTYEILRKQNTNQASHCFDFYLCIFFLSLGLDTSKQFQSILTLIV